MRLPTYFISHGAPDILLRPSPTRDFLSGFSGLVARPRAIVLASAHFMTRVPVVDADPAPDMIYDFGGFPDELYDLVYPAPGEPELARRIAGLMAEAGLDPAIAPKRGFDHGTWVPLMLMYPRADIPVVQIAVQPNADPAHHYRLGRALAPLAEENVLVIGSGAMTHNLSIFFAMRDEPAGAPPPWVTEFRDWLDDRIAAGAVEELADWRARAPHLRRNHPTDEHLLPLMVALGAAGEGARGTRIHEGFDGSVLALDAYAFGAATPG